MNHQPSREQLSIAIGALSSESIRIKLQGNELTALGRSVAEEELSRREKEGELDASPTAPAVELSQDSDFDFPLRPLGWSWGQWLVVVAISVLVVAMFGTTAKNKGDQAFLYGVVLIQSLALAGIVRTVAAIFSSSSALGVLGKLVAIGVFTYILLGLSLCSGLAQHGWGGG